MPYIHPKAPAGSTRRTSAEAPLVLPYCLEGLSPQEISRDSLICMVKLGSPAQIWVCCLVLPFFSLTQNKNNHLEGNGCIWAN